MLDKDGRPIELGRGAMGVTYKAVDVDLRRPVTLKVISQRYLGDESARIRFLREARTAASVHTSKRCHSITPGQNREQLISMRWSSSRERPSSISSNAPGGSK